MWTFRYMDILSPLMFWDGDFLVPGYFGMGTFRQRNISSQEHFGMGTFWLCGRSSAWTFCLHGRFGMETFWYLDITELENFGTRIFWHMDVLAHIHFGMMQCNRHFSKDISACMSLCQNVHMPKCLSIQKFDFFNDLKLHNYLKNKVLRAHAARHTPSCL